MIDVEVVTASRFEYIDSKPMNDDQNITVAMVAYIEDQRVWSYGDENREACELQLDVEGARFKVIRWAGKDRKLPEIFKQELKGAIATVILNKWDPSRPFGIEDVRVITPPLGAVVEVPEDEESTADTSDEG